MYDYAHTPLAEDTIKLTSFSSGDKLCAFIRGFFGLKGLPNFFTKQMSTFFETLIEQRFARVFIDDFLLLSNSTEHMFQLHIITSKNNLKLALIKLRFSCFLRFKFLGQEIGHNTIKPIHSKIAAIHKIPSPTGKIALMSFIGALNFYTKVSEKLHINLKPFTIFYMKMPHGNGQTITKLFSNNSKSLSLLKQNLQNQIQNIRFSLQQTLRAVLFQLNKENKIEVISFNSRIVNPPEQ